MTGTTTVLLRPNGQIIWFDAILSYNTTRSGEVTEHPIERGGVVADHFTLNNPTFALSGVISDADWNIDRLTTEALDSIQDYNEPNTGVVHILNNAPQETPAEIQYKENPLTRFVPEAAQGFLEQNAPVVVMEESYKYRTAEQMKRYLTAMHMDKEEFMIVEFTENKATDLHRHCFITNLSFTVDPDSGIEAIWPNLQIKSVKWVDSALVKVPKRVSDKMKKKVEPKQNKGAQTGTKTGEQKAPPARVSLLTQGVNKAKGTTQ